MDDAKDKAISQDDTIFQELSDSCYKATKLLSKHLIAFSEDDYLQKGTAVDSDILLERIDIIEDLCSEISLLLASIYAHTYKVSELFFQLGSSYLFPLKELDKNSTCMLCGKDAVYLHRGLKHKRYYRQALYCNKCGPVNDGLSLISTVNINFGNPGELNISFQVKNPFKLELLCHSVVSIQSFNGKYDTCSDIITTSLSPMSSSCANTYIKLHPLIPVGQHRVKIFLSIGPHYEMHSQMLGINTKFLD